MLHYWCCLSLLCIQAVYEQTASPLTQAPRLCVFVRASASRGDFSVRSRSHTVFFWTFRICVKALELTYMHKLHLWFNKEDLYPVSRNLGNIALLVVLKERSSRRELRRSVVHRPICLDRRRGVDARWESRWVVNETKLENDNESKSNRLIIRADRRFRLTLKLPRCFPLARSNTGVWQKNPK